jgi:ADP-glucose pyrophosphorylase
MYVVVQKNKNLKKMFNFDYKLYRRNIFKSVNSFWNMTIWLFHDNKITLYYSFVQNYISIIAGEKNSEQLFSTIVAYLE